MRLLAAIVAGGTFLCEAAQLPSPPQEKSLAKKIAIGTFGKTALIRTGVKTGIQHVRNTPHEWGRDGGGLVRRLGSVTGNRLIKTSVQTTVAHIRHEELKYQPSEDSGTGARLRHALLSTFVARKTTNGRPTVAAGRISGSFAAGLLSRLWHPARLRTFSSGLTTSGISLGFDAGFNVTREFWPDIRRRFRGRRT